MFIDEEFTLSHVTFNKINAEIERLWSELQTSPEMRQEAEAAGIDERSLATLAGDSVKLRQEAGIDPILTPIIVTFTSKVAYDVWKELLLPRLRAKWGANAITATKASHGNTSSHSSE